MELKSLYLFFFKYNRYCIFLFLVSCTLLCSFFSIQIFNQSIDRSIPPLLFFSVHVVDTFLLELPSRHAADFQSEGPPLGPLRQKLRTQGDSATNRWNREETPRKGTREEGAAEQQQVDEREVSDSAISKRVMVEASMRENWSDGQMLERITGLAHQQY